MRLRPSVRKLKQLLELRAQGNNTHIIAEDIKEKALKEEEEEEIVVQGNGRNETKLMGKHTLREAAIQGT